MDNIIGFLPVIFIFVLGIITKRINLFNKENADLFLKLVFYITLPALSLESISSVTLSIDMFYIPIAAMLTIFIVGGISYAIGRSLEFTDKTMGSFLIGSMIMNTGFTLPFFTTAFSDNGFVRASLFDLGNSILIFTFIYFVAMKYGKSENTIKEMAIKFLKLPPIYAIIIGIILNISHVGLPATSMKFLTLIGSPTIPLIMLSLGIYFHPKNKNLGKIGLVVFIRNGIGLLIGFVLAVLFHLEGLNRVIVIISSAAPVGYNTLIFSDMEDLDTEFSATLVSLSILIGIFYIPLLIYLI
jgi:predicted permease